MYYYYYCKDIAC